MKVRRVVVLSIAVVLLATGLWVVGGNAWAERRERQCDREWAAIFGSLDDLKSRYPRRETNETAKRLEVLAKALGLDLAPSVRTAGTMSRLSPVEAKRGQAVLDYISAQISKPEASIDAPPLELNRFFEEKGGNLDAIESLLIAGPPPQWFLDLSFPENDRMPNGLGHIRLQRVLMGRALTAAQGGHNEAAARSLEASWNLNESLRGRPETISALLGIAIARLEVGVLRKVNVEEDVWRKRLATLDPRTPLLDALNLEHRLKSRRAWWTAAVVGDKDGSWLQRARYLLAGPWLRLEMAHYSDVMRAEFARSMKAPLSDGYPEPSTKGGWGLASVFSSISIPNIQSSFVRADRLVVDAELTSKILEAKRLGKENGMRWPAAIPGIETSRFSGASWRYEVSPDGGRVSIAFSRELASPYGQSGVKPLPLRFSSN